MGALEWTRNVVGKLRPWEPKGQCLLLCPQVSPTLNGPRCVVQSVPLSFLWSVERDAGFGSRNRSVISIHTPLLPPPEEKIETLRDIKDFKQVTCTK